MLKIREGGNVWLIMIILHTLAGVVSFGLGVLVLSPRRAKRYSWALPAFLISLGGLVVFMLGAMLAHQYEISALEKVIFTGLVGLGLYMLYRGWQAQRLLQQQGTEQHMRYMDAIGFVLIALFDGFVIVGAIDLGAPGWAVAILAILGVVVGIKAVNRAKLHEQSS